MICDCCGVSVETVPGEDCLHGICDPYCLMPPPLCDPRPVDLACGFSHVTAGMPTHLPVQMGGEGDCFCGETISCEARVVGRGRLSLSTGICSMGALCDACFPFIEGACELPPLDEGRWQVDINGAPGFELDALPPDILPERGAICITAAGREGACGAMWPTFPHSTSGIRWPMRALAGQRVALHVRDDCGGCEEVPGPCQVDVFDNTIRVRPTELALACDVDCPAICIPRDDTCWTPPLEAGTWQVVVDTLPAPVGTIFVTDPGVPPIPGEACTATSDAAGGV